MKVLFISPYLKQHHTGGGEKHLFDVALSLPKQWQLQFGIPTETDITDADFDNIAEKTREIYQIFLGKSLNRISFIRTPLFTQASWLIKLWWTRQFDHLYYVTDGSLFFSMARNNLLHIQTPLTDIGPSVMRQLKQLSWQSVNTNSKFTKKVVEHYWKLKVTHVLHPAVDDEYFVKPKRKDPVILSVGRFFPQLHSKRQDILVTAFRQLLTEQPRLLRDWELHLVGTIEHRAYFDSIKKMAQGLPIIFHTDVDHVSLVKLFHRSRLFWHAAGYEIDQSKHPEKVEHFGIATAEAMAARSIPLVVPSGGQTEIIPEALRDLSWTSVKELLTNTVAVLKNPKRETKLRSDVYNQARLFSMQQLQKEVRKLFYV